MDHPKLTLPENRVPRAKRINASELDGPEIVTESIWHNPTDRVVRLELYVGVDQEIKPKLKTKPGRVNAMGVVRLTHEERTGVAVYEIGPGERVSLPSEFDKAIQDVRGGVICGGLGPQLRKDGTQYSLHPALDDAIAQREAAVREALNAQQEKKAAEEAAIIAQARIEKAEADIQARAQSGGNPQQHQHQQQKTNK